MPSTFNLTNPDAVRLRFRCCAVLGAVLFLVSAAAFAETLTGKVTNGTNDKPSAGDDVVLIKLAQGMQEAGRAKTDPQGNFKLDVDNLSEPHLVRVNHQGVSYYQPAPPGTSSVNVQVFDVAKKLDAISTTVDVMRFQAQNGQLQVLELFAVQNNSKPPRSQMSDQNYDISLPPGAQIDTSLAKAPGGQPVNSAPVPLKQKGRYTFVFPLRPGETQFELGYHLPYSGQAKIDPKPLVAQQHFVVMLPKQMQFKADSAARFQNMPDDNGSANVQVATEVQPGEALGFTVSGTGVLASESEQGGSQGAGLGGPQTSADSRPGGGLGPPTDSPDPLNQWRWYILGGFVAMLGFGAIYMVTRQSNLPAPARAAAARAGNGGKAAVTRAATPAATTAPPQDHSGMLLQALKEELFQLEIERQQGKISATDYEKAKAALDQTLHRAVTRKKQ
ncbi:MAG TPA: carboxypeptidase regulatory-like domain-containing protein [Terriglobales bacterium]|nr:carboxypeptidase regulatory-like domain-containing protein [Terriglobales bacterium]